MPERSKKANLNIRKSWSDRLSLLLTDVFGSLVFLTICFFFFALWIIWNSGLIPGLKPIDQYPFPVLEMVVSIFAVILSVSVLISQNRQGKLEKIRQEVEFEVNVRAENEITKILKMLHTMQKKMGIHETDTERELN